MPDCFPATFQGFFQLGFARVFAARGLFRKRHHLVVGFNRRQKRLWENEFIVQPVSVGKYAGAELCVSRPANNTRTG